MERKERGKMTEQKDKRELAYRIRQDGHKDEYLLGHSKALWRFSEKLTDLHETDSIEIGLVFISQKEFLELEKEEKVNRDRAPDGSWPAIEG